MKVKNIAFSGFMAAVLMGAAATPADAVTVASREYVDAREGAILKTVGDTYLTTEVAENTYVKEGDVTNAITNAVTGNEALAGALADKEDKDNKVNEITDENKGSTTLYPSLSAISKYVVDINSGSMGTLGALAKENQIDNDLVADNANIAQSKIEGLTTLATQVGTNKTAIETLNGGVGTTGSVANTIAQALNDGGQIDVALDGKQDKLSDEQISAIAQVATNTQSIADNAGAIATNAQGIAQNAEDIAQNAEDIAKNAEDIAKKADAEATTTALAGKVNATGQTANQIMITDADGKVVTTAKISAAQVDALGRLATAEVPESCTNESGTMCVLSINQEGKYAWTAITEPTPQNP